MASEFKIKNGLIVVGDVSTSGTITINGALAATQSWVASQAYLTSSSLTSYATQSYVTSAIASLVDSAPGALDTLRELATALGNDASFSTTVTNSIAAKLPLAGGTLTGALSGTSATFSGRVQSSGGGNGTTDGGFKINNYSNASSRSYLLLNDVTAYGDFGVYQSTTQTGSTYSSLLYFTLAGAATFSSSVQTTDLRYSGSGYLTYGTGTVGTETFIIRNGAASPALTIAYGGAATFSSSLTVERIQINSSTYEPLAINSSYGQVGLKFGLNGSYFAAIGSANNVTGAYAGSETDLGIGTSGSATANITFVTGTGLGRRMTITAAGNVGIGTTTPSTKLDVNGGSRFRGNLDLDANQRITGQYWVNGGSELTYLQMYNGGDASINIGTKHWLGYISFESGNGAYTERMRITNTGNVGIGTTSPSYLLDVNGTGRFSGNLTGSSFTFGGGTFSSLVTFNGGLNSAAYLTVGGVATFNNTATFNSTLTGTSATFSGNVGIGTTSPVSVLHIEQIQNAESLITLRNNRQDLGNVPIFGISAQNSTVDIARISFYRGGGGSSGYLTFSTKFDNASSLTEKVRIDGAGNVGIGTTSPSTKLNIYSDTTADGILVDILSRPRITLRDRGNSDTIIGTGDYGLDDFFIDTYSGNALAIKGSTRNVGIGTTSPNYKLDVNGYINIYSGNGLRWGSGDAEIINSGYSLLFKTYNGSALAEVMRITTAGNVGIGSVLTESYALSDRLRVRGGAIQVMGEDVANVRYRTLISSPLDFRHFYMDVAANTANQVIAYF